jgi:predicted SprT family Zn-dependent metalloprotease
MKIRIKVNQPACTYQALTLKGRYLTLKGIDLKRSRERYTCNACGKPVVRTLKMSVP